MSGATGYSKGRVADGRSRTQLRRVEGDRLLFGDRAALLLDAENHPHRGEAARVNVIRSQFRKAFSPERLRPYVQERRRQKSCERKVAHRTEAAAHVHADQLRRDKPSWDGEPYPCPWCDMWHVGRPSRRRTRMVRSAA